MHIGKSFYTAIVLRPYARGGAYLINLTGTIAEATVETPRATLVMPLGTPITVTALSGEHIMARIGEYARLFQIMIRTRLGTLNAVEVEV